MALTSCKDGAGFGGLTRRSKPSRAAKGVICPVRMSRSRSVSTAATEGRGAGAPVLELGPNASSSDVSAVKLAVTAPLPLRDLLEAPARTGPRGGFWATDDGVGVPVAAAPDAFACRPAFSAPPKLIFCVTRQRGSSSSLDSRASSTALASARAVPPTGAGPAPCTASSLA
eukprot:scaffold910_cov396-Prasinococcus_capsulatus_cf.AAC.17